MALKYDGIPDITQSHIISYFKQHARQKRSTLSQVFILTKEFPTFALTGKLSNVSCL